MGLSEGLDLVRIGTPRRSEFAAWRFGVALRRGATAWRRRKRRRQRPDARATAAAFLTQSAAMMVGAVAGEPYTLTSSRRWPAAVVDPATGACAIHAMAGPLLGRLSSRGGTRMPVLDATRRITDAGEAARDIRRRSARRVTRREKNTIFWDDDVGVLGLTVTERRALEIAMNEDAERQAMQGELSAIENAWRDGAEIADSMFTP